MNKTNPVIIAGALVAVLGAGVLAFVAQDDSASAGGGPTVKALVASSAVAAGTQASSSILVVKDVPARFVPQGTPDDVSDVEGQVALRALAKDELVTPGSFGTSGVAAAGGVVLPKGKEGLGIELAFAPGGLRYVVPGNKIAVWSTRKPANGGAATATRILDAVQVIATTPGAGTGAATDVTATPGALQFLLAVDKTEASKLIAAQVEGSSLYFTLVDTRQGTS